MKKQFEHKHFTRHFISLSNIMMFLLSVSRIYGATGFDFNEIQVGADIPDEGQYFGSSVAIDGNVAAIGVPLEGIRTYGEAGVVYVYEHCEGGWIHTATLASADPENYRLFGEGNIVVSGNTIAVGSPIIPGGYEPAIHIYERNYAVGADGWGLAALITPPVEIQGYSFFHFGGGFDLCGNTIVAGAFAGDEFGNDMSMVYVFERNEGGAGNWGLARSLTADGAPPGQHFGGHLGISGNTIAVARTPENPAEDGTCVIHIHEKNRGGAGNWGETTRLIVGEERKEELNRVALDIFDNTIVVGGDLLNTDGFDSAYIFQREEGGAGNWGQVKELTSGVWGDYYGHSIAIDGDSLVIGAQKDDSSDPEVFGAGAAYVYRRNEGGMDNWGVVGKINSTDATTSCGFGGEVAVSEGWILIGAGAQVYQGHGDAGSAYFFD